MSIEAISAVLERSKQHGNALLTLVVIAEHADRDGLAWPSAARIAQRARIDLRSCWRIVRQLQRDNEIAIERGGGRGRSNRYRILLLNSDTANSDSRNTDRRNSDLFDETVTKRAQNSDTGVTRTVIVESSTEPCIYKNIYKNRVGNPARSSRSKTPLPVDFSLTPSRRDLLTSLHLDAEAFFAHFRDQAIAQDYRYRNWDAALRVWARKESRDSRSRFRVTPPSRPRGKTFDEQLAARRAALANGEVQ